MISKTFNNSKHKKNKNSKTRINYMILKTSIVEPWVNDSPNMHSIYRPLNISHQNVLNKNSRCYERNAQLRSVWFLGED